MWPKIKYISTRKTRIVDLGWVNFSPYNFVASGPNFTNFFWFKERRMALNKAAIYTVLIFLSVLEMFAIKFEICPELRQIFSCSPKF